MRSEHADRFNHDDDAADYDRDVLDERHPIRAGYDALLSWVAAQVPPGSEVIDLGCGTGNLALRLASPARVIGVDVSEKMSAMARAKLAGRPFEVVCADLLAAFDTLPVVDAIVSTYAIHHLTDAEKPLLFERIYRHLRPGGVAALGDLMFESRAAERDLLAGYADGGRGDLADAIRDEFFWYLDESVVHLQALGFRTATRRFSELSRGVRAVKPAGAEG